MGRLESRMAEFVADAHAVPGHHRLRRTPAVFADGRGGIRDAAIDGHIGRIVQDDALDLSAVNGKDGTFRKGSGTRGQRQRGEEGQNSFHISQVKQRIPDLQAARVR